MLQNRPLILMCLAILLVLTGCEPEIRVVRSSWDDFPADPKPRQNAQGNGGQQNDTWSIQVAEFTGRDRIENARESIEQIRSSAAVAELWIEDTGEVASVFQGRFNSASDPLIRPTLSRIQSVQINDKKPFKDAQLVPLAGTGRVISDPLDLAQFVGYYSLQIGFYDKNYDGDFRAAAEEAVRTLREEGYEAYYYHGPFRSIIAIGVYSYEQAFVSAGTHDTYAPCIRELQEKFPYNLGNGVTLIQKQNGQVIGEQRSSLIRVF